MKVVDLIPEGALLVASGLLSALLAQHPRNSVQTFGPGFVFGLFFALLKSPSVGRILLYALVGALAYFVAVSLGGRLLRSKRGTLVSWKIWSVLVAGGVAGACGAFSLASALPLLELKIRSVWAVSSAVSTGAIAGALFLVAQEFSVLRRLPSLVSGALLFGSWQVAVAISLEQSIAPGWRPSTDPSLDLTLSTVILPVLGIIAAVIQILDFLAPPERKSRRLTLD